MTGTTDIAVVGAGIVGLATARELLRRDRGRRVVVLEKETGVARHQTSHNSGVVHSGVYYRPGSAKARLCVRGSQLMRAYCEEREIPFEVCGKLVVATHEDELGRFGELRERARANGLSGVEELDEAGMRRIEPHLRGLRALHIPSAAIVDFARVAASLADEVRALGGEIRLGERVDAISLRPSDVQVTTPSGTLTAGQVVGCAGLYSDRLARAMGAEPYPRIMPFRGSYYVLRSERRQLLRGLIYPVPPDPRLPFLGPHFIRRLDGQVWLGPNAAPALGRESYGRTDVDLGETLETFSSGGAWRLMLRFWRSGAAELRRDLWKPAFLAEVRRFMPELTADDLLPGPSGVRAQAVSRDGSLVDDFEIDSRPRCVNVRNAPSPAATSSLAIAEVIADRTEQAANAA